ncbi:MAG TPA: N-acetylmuramic acid 6-phosphate etherase [Gemmatimonadales bacterium]|jgi:N-acetylmuramic acid 6-phosphate etherase
MTPVPPLDSRLTEQRNPASAAIDLASPLEIVDIMNREDAHMIEAVHSVRTEIARAISLVEAAFRAGGHLYYFGAGTSGRLGVLDASECPPTFGSDPSIVEGTIAGGMSALVKSAEGAEDDAAAGAAAVDAKHAGPNDVIFGIAASGGTPFVKGAIGRGRLLGAGTVLLACTDPPADLLGLVDVAILPKVGPEVLTGSTRLKAGTATKMVLNMVTTGAMIRIGKAYGNLMVDLRALSAKLHDRAERIVMEVCGVSREQAKGVIAAAGGHVKTAIVMQKLSVTRAEAEALLDRAGGYARKAVGDPPPVLEQSARAGGR